jgi:hypothetical protein
MRATTIGVLMAVRRARRRERLGRPHSCIGTLQQPPKFVHLRLRLGRWLELGLISPAST